MTAVDYCTRIDATAPARRWKLVRGWIAAGDQDFFVQMRAQRPVLALPQVTLAFRHADVMLVLRRHADFGVDLYKPKQGAYFMAQDDTAAHWREKSVMKAVLDFEQVPAIRAFVAARTAAVLAAAGGRIDLVAAVTRPVPAAVVQEFFGLDGIAPEKLIEWSYWNQQDAFRNQPFDLLPAKRSAMIIARREAAKAELGQFIAGLVMARTAAVKAGGGGTDPVSRLIRISLSGGTKFGITDVMVNAGGLLIGAVETTSHCAINVLSELFARPDVLAAAQAAARDGDPEAVDGFAMEAMRFRPAFPWFFRTCHAATELAGGSGFAHVAAPGTTVLALAGSAMTDPAGFPEPRRFDAGRRQGDNLLFGHGIHECLGRAVAQPMLAEIVRQVLLLPGLRLDGPIVLNNGVPEAATMVWDAQ